MSVLYLGDIHGQAYALRAALAYAQDRGHTTIVQVGDMGVYPQTKEKIYAVMKDFKDSGIRVIYCHGNHEDFNLLSPFFAEPRKLHPVFDGLNLLYAPIGLVEDIDGVVHTFIGGGASIDEQYRRSRGMHWDRRENITTTQFNDVICNSSASYTDVLVSHVPTLKMVRKYFDDKDTAFYGVGRAWTDPNMILVEHIADTITPKWHISGHMHRFVEDVAARHTILAIDQTYTLPLFNHD
jgi:hypothetical protein